MALATNSHFLFFLEIQLKFVLQLNKDLVTGKVFERFSLKCGIVVNVEWMLGPKITRSYCSIFNHVKQFKCIIQNEI